MFSRPALLWLLLIPPGLGLLGVYAHWARRRTLAKLGNRFRIGHLVQVRPWRRWLIQTCISLGLTALLLGLAGPHWGQERVETRSPERDLVVVLDVSRSMRAEPHPRLDRGLRMLDQLNTSLRTAGRVRLGLVLAAAYPRVQLPLGQDYDHFALLLDRARREDLPPELWHQPENEIVSGTRLGAALSRAAALRPSDPGRAFDILLVSDGDDPVEDEEWRQGVQAARAANVPVHVLGIGDPERAYPLPGKMKAMSRINVKLLQEIARGTGGNYLDAHAEPHYPLEAHMEAIWKVRRAEELLKDGAAPELFRPQPQQAWFYLSGLVFFALALLVREVPSLARKSRRVLPRLLALPLVLLLVSASPVPSVDDLIRQGNEAFARDEHEQALKLFEKAEAQTLDPGLVAFNKGAALFRLGRFREAAAHYKRALEDAAAPPERQRKAWYDLGTSLLKASSGNQAEDLRGAANAFRSCLELEPADARLAEDARFNLELAQRLWVEARANPPKKEPGPNGSDPQPKKGKKEKEKSPADPTKDPAKDGKTDKKGLDKTDAVEPKNGEGKDKKEVPGSRLVLKDKELQELSPEQMNRLLLEQVERISRARLILRKDAAANLKEAINR